MHSEGKCTADTEEGIRLNRYLASCGVASRREADRLIEEGLVAVDGAAAVPGTRVTGNEVITVRGKRIAGADQKAVVAWYKPRGVTTTEKDPHAARTVKDAFHYPVRLTYAGRLDRDSEGLLLMTNDGDLIDAMMRGANRHEKEYVVHTRSRISDEQLSRMQKGIYLKDLNAATRPCRITRLGDRSFRIVLTQGLNRQIRRMCRAVGAEVQSLKRVRVLNITLEGLKPGMQREIRGEELGALYRAAGLARSHEN